MKEATIRPWLISDAPALYELCKDKTIRKQWVSKLPYPYTIIRAKKCIAYYQHANPLRYCIFAILYQEQIKGCIQCEVKGYHSAELTYWMRYDDIHKGYLQSIIKHICAYAFSKFSITTIYAKLSMDNIELSKLYLENGFIESIDTAPIYLYFLHRF
ncbi:MAG: GNAT family N-acetyltransferase [Erysipelotrichaceae bacterium]|nr:GNAT family N-acetyltransferase [Erysipelotrichaceae bacterium]MCI9524075.1 GNAT family N-acetyltransferase [Erysipelotrichaceae bacterium]